MEGGGEPFSLIATEIRTYFVTDFEEVCDFKTPRAAVTRNQKITFHFPSLVP